MRSIKKRGMPKGIPRFFHMPHMETKFHRDMLIHFLYESTYSQWLWLEG